jgi:hypothetical protein
MALDTLADVDAAIARAEAMPMKPPSQLRIRQATLADLWEVKAQLFEAARDNAGDQIPQVFLIACGYAAQLARRQVVFFRDQATSRRVKRARS